MSIAILSIVQLIIFYFSSIENNNQVNDVYLRNNINTPDNFILIKCIAGLQILLLFAAGANLVFDEKNNNVSFDQNKKMDNNKLTD